MYSEQVLACSYCSETGDVKTMKRNTAQKLAATSLMAALLASAHAWTSEWDDAETTIRLMAAAEADRPDVVTNEIALPPNATVDVEAVHDVEHAGRPENPGVSNVAEAALENRAQAATDALEAREERGRRDEAPGMRDDPGRPDTPPGRPGD